MKYVHVVFALLLTGALSSCSGFKHDIIQVGPWFSPKPSKEVEVFASKDETRKPWGGIAIIHGEDIPVTDAARITKHKVMARKMAAEIGADGLILTMSEVAADPRLGVYQEPQVYLSALAFKYVTDISTAAQK